MEDKELVTKTLSERTGGMYVIIVMCSVRFYIPKHAYSVTVTTCS